jgi:release factor glutamine methyltransferase
MTVKQALGIARDRLKPVTNIPQKEAMILLAHLLGVSQTWLVTNDGGKVDEALFFALVSRREAHEPIEYITGKASFFGLDFAVSPACLIPRPETELLVELAVAEAMRIGAKSIADVCTGSGAIAVMLAKMTECASVIASDISADALGMAKQNALEHEVSGQISFFEADLLDGLPHADIIVSNPPYIADSYALPDPVKYEPSLALFSGVDGADILRRLIAQFAESDAKSLLCEFGYDQREIVQNFCQKFDFASPEFFKDYAGFDRGFTIRKQ